MRPAQRALSRERSELHFDAQPVRPLLKRLFTSRVPPLTNIGSRIDLIDDLEVGENLPRRKLFDLLLVQAVEPIKERPLVRRQFRMLFGARHGDSEHGARSTFIFAASLARSRPRPRRLSSRRALRAARQVLEFLSASFSRTIAPWTLRFLSQSTNPQIAVQKMQVAVQKMQVKQSFSFVLLLKQETNVRRKESSYEKVRSMPWEAGTRCPLP